MRFSGESTPIHAGNKPIIPLHPEIAAALSEAQLTSSGPLFRYRDGRQVPPYVVSQRVRRHLQKLGIDATAHQPRHTFGTKLYRATHDLRLTQEMLGHASPLTTAMFAAFDQSEASIAVARIGLGD